MIIQLTEGIGNQLFQCAFGESLKKKFGYNLSYDFRFVPDNEKVIIKKFFPNLKKMNFFQKIFYYFFLFINRFRAVKVIVDEKYFNYDQDIFENIKKNSYLRGYWQSEKYFLYEKNTFQNLDLDIVKESKFYNTIINDNKSVSMHIRRGDYLNSITVNYHGICSKNYYNEALKSFRKIDSAFNIYIFSDDIEWCKENLTGNNFIFVENKNFPAIVDLLLMSKCRHNIIANSTFSWWAAYLNRNEDKVVYYPEPWFEPLAENNTKDLIPEGWRALPKHEK